jgi:hypothetical protein
MMKFFLAHYHSLNRLILPFHLAVMIREGFQQQTDCAKVLQAFDWSLPGLVKGCPVSLTPLSENIHSLVNQNKFLFNELPVPERVLFGSWMSENIVLLNRICLL